MEYSAILAFVFGFVLLLLVAVAIVGIPRKLLDADRRVQEAVINSQLVRWSGDKLVVRDPADIPPRRVRRILRGQESVEESSAVRSTARTIRAGLPRSGGLARRLAVEGILVMVFGFLAVVGVDAILGLSSPSSSIEFSALVDTVLTGIGNIPGLDLVFSLLLTAVVLVGELVYTLWWLVALTLLSGAAAVHRLDLSRREELVVKAVSVAPVPLLLTYVFVAISNGSLGELITVLTASTLRSVFLIVVTGVLLGVVVVRGVRTAGNIGRSAQDWMSRASMTALAHASTKPLAVAGIVAVVFFVLSLYNIGQLQAIGAAIGVAVLYRVAYGVVSAVRYRYAKRKQEDDPRPRSTVVIELGTIEDKDGETLYVARVQGTGLLNDSLDQFSVDVANYAGELLEDGTKRPTLSGHRYRAARKGTVDRADARRELRQEIRYDVLDGLEQKGPRLSQDRVEDYLADEYPSPFWRQVLHDLIYEEQRVEPVGDEYRSLD